MHSHVPMTVFGTNFHCDPKWNYKNEIIFPSSEPAASVAQIWLQLSGSMLLKQSDDEYNLIAKDKTRDVRWLCADKPPPPPLRSGSCDNNDAVLYLHPLVNSIRHTRCAASCSHSAWLDKAQCDGSWMKWHWNWVSGSCRSYESMLGMRRKWRKWGHFNLKIYRHQPN